MSAASNTALVRRLCEAGGDAAVIQELTSADLLWDVTPGFPCGGVYHGVEGVFDYFGKLMPQFDSWHTEVEGYHASGDARVFVVGHYRPAKSGVSEPVRFIQQWTVRDGKLAGMSQAADSAVAQRLVNG
ncbi:nuclear transport factor 2 family protein [Streptomyces sp. SID9727]|uniref:nuclear transport factor 2 family protein n=1 Tax=Streptomyces sp. SID9727 TaxID=2706114 RepID=UPI0013C73F46|nr:nuclear transport factor 2 family protein [Streptomyces sp. SID9727]NEC67716.1 nuclear transport factor 2 family protein [Streptomyces sp. SID9727]